MLEIQSIFQQTRDLLKLYLSLSSNFQFSLSFSLDSAVLMFWFALENWSPMIQLEVSRDAECTPTVHQFPTDYYKLLLKEA